MHNHGARWKWTVVRSDESNERRASWRAVSIDRIGAHAWFRLLDAPATFLWPMRDTVAIDRGAL